MLQCDAESIYNKHLADVMLHLDLYLSRAAFGLNTCKDPQLL